MATLRRVGDSLYGYFEESIFDSKVSANSKPKLQGLQQSNRFLQKNRKIVLNAMFLYTKMPLITFERRFVCAHAVLFFYQLVSKNVRKNHTVLCLEDIRGLTNGSEKRLEQHFGGFYFMNKRAPANRKKGFHTIRPLKN